MQSYSKKRDGKEFRRKFGGIGAISVRTRPGKCTQAIVVADKRVFAGALGRGGISAGKREGDGATPLAPPEPRAPPPRARWALRAFCPGGGRMPAASRLPLVPIRPDMGWCDAPADPNYNRPVRLPFKASHEKMERGDRLYDAVIVLDWNIRPRRRNCGSAIFLHVARPDYRPTEGCVAISPAAMRWLLRHVSRRTVLRILR